MMIKKVCAMCGAEFEVPHWRMNKAKYCSTACQNQALHATANVVCGTCGKVFHLKKSAMERYPRTMGFFCSKKCASIARVDFMTGNKNHQFNLKGEKNDSFKGNEINKLNNQVVDIMVYTPDRPDANKSGRIPKHRLVVEQNYMLFPQECFDIIGDFHVLKREYMVHHKDGNHNNNDVNNLAIVTKSEHTSIHNRMRNMERDKKTGRFIKKQKDDTK